MDNVTAIGFPAMAGSGAGPTAIQNVYASDAATFLESMTDRCGNTTIYGYDALLRRSVVESSLGSVTTSQFDPLGRLATNIVTTGGSNLLTTMFYDVLDQATNIVHPDGKIEVRGYDSFGQMIAQSGAGQYPIDYGYDLAGNRTNMIDGNGSETAWIYDGRNRVVQKIYADRSSYHYGTTVPETSQIASTPKASRPPTSIPRTISSPPSITPPTPMSSSHMTPSAAAPS